MPVFFRATDLPVSAEEADAWHRRPGAFECLVPPWQKVEVIRRTGLVEPGALLEMRVIQVGVPIRMLLVHKPLDEPGHLGFVDEQVEGPFASWHQKHRIVPTGPSSSRMEDEIHWEAPAGTALARVVADAKLERMFRYRHRRLVADLAHHAVWAGRPRRTVAISGTTGLLGSALHTFLTTGGHGVRRMVRGEAEETDIAWNPATGAIDVPKLAMCDAVVHLAGASISTRWTSRAKEQILRSRVEGTALVARTLAAIPESRRPKVLVSASAVGWYGSREGEVLTEASTPGGGFLADVCQAWEAATAPARDAGIRVVHPRIGIVMSGRGGALPPLAAATRLGMGGPMGTGAQYVSWISVDDLVAGLLAGIMDERLTGPYNATAPSPVPQREFAQTLGRALHRPARMPLPAIAVQLVAGEMGRELLLDGQRVEPRRLLDTGFAFAFPELETALRHELGRP